MPNSTNSRAVNLHASFSKVQESLAKAFDALGVKRSFTVPYVDQQETAEHVKAVGAAAAQSGGLAKNLVTSAHASGGKGWGHGDGETAGHPTHDLQNTIIPKDNEDVLNVLSAAQSHLNNIKTLLGDDKTVITAQHQLDMIKERDAAGMTAFDLGVGITALLTPPMQAVARAQTGPKLRDTARN